VRTFSEIINLCRRSILNLGGTIPGIYSGCGDEIMEEKKRAH
jgi:hypothetical protein